MKEQTNQRFGDVQNAHANQGTNELKGGTNIQTNELKGERTHTRMN